ncbi:MAG: rhomboid family intramembrane serine protease [Pseudomonadales bacterium]|nr:rhomboid family intramembrane serine protease [Pseudomonadales bacterium]
MIITFHHCGMETVFTAPVPASRDLKERRQSLRTRTPPLPVLTIGLVIITALLQFLLPASGFVLLALDLQTVSDQPWQLVTGHLVHSDVSHWFWDMLAFTIAGALAEMISKRFWFTALVAGLLAVNLLLISPLCTLTAYCGFSGVLNTFIFLVLAREILISHRSGEQRLWPWLLTAVCLMKLGAELWAGQALLTNTDWQSYPMAHLAGFVGACAAIPFALRPGTAAVASHV